MADPGSADRPPRLLLIGGGTSVGKTTLAKAVAHELGFTRIVSTDTIREVLRAASGPDAPAALNMAAGLPGLMGAETMRTERIGTVDFTRCGGRYPFVLALP